MASILLFAALCVQLCVGLMYESETAVCERSWVERHTYSKDLTVAVPTENLRTNILKGKPVKVSLRAGEHVESFLLDNLNMNGEVICGEAVDRMTSPIGPDAEDQPIIVCTDGFTSYLNASATSWDSSVGQNVWTVDSISFRTRDMSPEDNALMTLYLDGSSTSEHGNYIEAVRKCELRGVMRDRGYTFTMENTKFDDATMHINGQSLSHISQSYTGQGGIMFRNKPYYWLSSWETTGLRDSARWTVGDVTPLRHTNDYVALQWYADSCWTIVYSHDAQGVREAGSLDMLKMYIRMGHRIRVNFDGFTLEPSTVYITPEGDVLAQTSVEMARRGGNGDDKTFFNTKTRRVYRLIQTSGLVRTLYYFIENGQLSAKQGGNFAIRWSVDTRPWNPVLSQDSTNAVTFGSVADLRKVMTSESLRVKVELREKVNPKDLPNPEMYLEINNVRSKNYNAATPEIVGQSLRTVPFYRTPEGNYNMRLYKPSRQYIEISTASGVQVSHFDLATKDFRQYEDWEVVGITWFKDGRI